MGSTYPGVMRKVKVQGKDKGQGSDRTWGEDGGNHDQG